jgi:uncharacterized protein
MKKKKKTLLWQIETGANVPPSYVFGTMHVRDQRAFKYKELVESKILECDAFAAEINLEEVDHLLMAESMDLPEDQLLSDILKPKIYAKVDKIFNKLVGVSLTHFPKSQPFLILNILTERLLSTDMPLSLDATLHEFAVQNEKIALGIESFEEQIEILSKISIDFQIKSLSWMAKNFKQFRKQLFKMTADYETSDVQKIFKSAKKSTKGLRKVLLYDRNKIMAQRIATMAKEQSIFVAIGAGHLGGQKGVLRLLKKEGLKTRPILLKKGENKK